jgi:hypothetical protein
LVDFLDKSLTMVSLGGGLRAVPNIDAFSTLLLCSTAIIKPRVWIHLCSSFWIHKANVTADVYLTVLANEGIKSWIIA